MATGCHEIFETVNVFANIFSIVVHIIYNATPTSSVLLYILYTTQLQNDVEYHLKN